MKLFTKQNIKDLTVDTSEMDTEDIIVKVKLFGGSSFSWYLYEYNEESKEFRCYLDTLDPMTSEFGYYRLEDFMAMRFPPFGLGVERDRWFNPTPLKDLIRNF